MSSPDDDKDLDGLTRSIDALFSEGSARNGSPEAEGEDPPRPKEPGPEPDQEERAAGGHIELGEELFQETSPEESDFARELMGTHDVSGSDEAPDEAQQEEAPEGSTDELVWEDVTPEDAELGDAAAEADPDALEEAVSRFFGSPALERDGLASDVRAAAAALREARAFDPLADAVEKLALSAGDPPDEACLAMARWLVTPGVGARLAARLGQAREEDRRAELFLLCRRIGHEMAVAISEALADTTDRFARRTYLDAVVAMGEASAAVVEEMAEDPRWFVVRNALTILGEVGGDRAVEVVTGALANENPRVRREAILALAKIGGEDAGVLVSGMLEDSDSDVRLAAAMAVGALKVERALRTLLGVLEHETDYDVVTAVLHALGQIGDPGAVIAIEKRAVGTFFSRPPPDVRIAAYRALHHIGTPHAMQVLQAAAEDKDPQVRSAVREVLGQR